MESAAERRVLVQLLKGAEGGELGEMRRLWLMVAKREESQLLLNAEEEESLAAPALLVERKEGKSLLAAERGAGRRPLREEKRREGQKE